MRRSLLLLLALVLAVPLTAQRLRGPVLRPSALELDAAEFGTGQFDGTRIIVKFCEGERVRLREGELRDAQGQRPAGLPTLDDVRVVRLFERSEQDLDRERERILAQLPEGFDPPADLNNYYLCISADAARGKALCAALLNCESVETAFADHRPGIDADPSGDLPPTTPDFELRQDFWGAPPIGIGIAHAQQLDGGRGEELQLLDIETGLILDHEDVPRAVQANVIGPNPYPRDHGLAVAGELVADRNGYGVQGGAFRAGYKFHSHQSRNWASSVSVATQNSRPGDVIILEVQLAHSVSRKYVPMESRQDVFDAVRSATLLGIHVFAAAGNGSENLDAAVYQGIFDRNVRDSGAVLVGATEGTSLARASFSNYGAIVDVNGPGRNVTTTGYTDLFHPNSDSRQRYTATFSGTSSATPVATSAGAVVLSAARRQLGRTLTPAELRQLLRQHGTAIPSGNIGVRPDCEALLAAIGLPAGLAVVGERSRVGTPIPFALEGKSGQAWVLYASGANAQLKTPFGRFLLDPASMFPVAFGLYDKSGHARIDVPVPNLPSLLWHEVYWQSLRVDPGLALSLSSSVVTFLER